ncbi:hypothetical protein J31TS4_17700 [Paenibacillus sp. J31TS4]|uniref:hypothetical protein n=1 Tax=Paenibacillus sp. J31TS4 TaxID=2807195 RepID=UPI001B2DF416|nr:hypothetical protein [Paenibacillus sp. J31TS4]GIP38490.1 hypothetical protein J31TS4_17700 [Paenibacillus sp. J31TS4]
MSAGWRYRCRLRLVLWLRSPFGWAVLLVGWGAAELLRRSFQRGPELAGAIYEQEGMLLAALTMSWVFSLDFDSRFVTLLGTYPIRRWSLLLERGLLGSVLMLLIMSSLTLLLYPDLGVNGWRFLAFCLPVSFFVGAAVAAGTVVAGHSLGGLLAALAFWSLAMASGDALGPYSPTILPFPNVVQAAAYWGVRPDVEWELWVLRNRLLYLAGGLMLWGASAAWFTWRNRD